MVACFRKATVFALALTVLLQLKAASSQMSYSYPPCWAIPPFSLVEPTTGSRLAILAVPYGDPSNPNAPTGFSSANFSYVSIDGHVLFSSAVTPFFDTHDLNEFPTTSPMQCGTDNDSFFLATQKTLSRYSFSKEGKLEASVALDGVGGGLACVEGYILMGNTLFKTSTLDKIGSVWLAAPEIPYTSSALTGVSVNEDGTVYVSTQFCTPDGSTCNMGTVDRRPSLMSSKPLWTKSFREEDLLNLYITNGHSKAGVGVLVDKSDGVLLLAEEDGSDVWGGVAPGVFAVGYAVSWDDGMFYYQEQVAGSFDARFCGSSLKTGQKVFGTNFTANIDTNPPLMVGTDEVWYMAAGGLAVLNRHTGKLLQLKDGVYNSNYYLGSYFYFKGLAYAISYGGGGGGVLFSNVLFSASGTSAPRLTRETSDLLHPSLRLRTPDDVFPRGSPDAPAWGSLMLVTWPHVVLLRPITTNADVSIKDAAQVVDLSTFVKIPTNFTVVTATATFDGDTFTVIIAVTVCLKAEDVQQPCFVHVLTGGMGGSNWRSSMLRAANAPAPLYTVAYDDRTKRVLAFCKQMACSFDQDQACPDPNNENVVSLGALEWTNRTAADPYAGEATFLQHGERYIGPFNTQPTYTTMASFDRKNKSAILLSSTSDDSGYFSPCFLVVQDNSTGYWPQVNGQYLNLYYSDFFVDAGIYSESLGEAVVMAAEEGDDDTYTVKFDIDVDKGSSGENYPQVNVAFGCVSSLSPVTTSLGTTVYGVVPPNCNLLYSQPTAWIVGTASGSSSFVINITDAVGAVNMPLTVFGINSPKSEEMSYSASVASGMADGLSRERRRRGDHATPRFKSRRTRGSRRCGK